MRLFGPAEPVLKAAESQMHRRFFKTHFPLDAVPLYEGVKVIHVARDGRDAALSFHNHLANFAPNMVGLLQETSRARPKFGDASPPIPADPAEFFADWVSD